MTWTTNNAGAVERDGYIYFPDTHAAARGRFRLREQPGGRIWHQQVVDFPEPLQGVGGPSVRFLWDGTLSEATDADLGGDVVGADGLALASAGFMFWADLDTNVSANPGNGDGSADWLAKVPTWAKVGVGLLLAVTLVRRD